jgi:hypothetical protein
VSPTGNDLELDDSRLPDQPFWALGLTVEAAAAGQTRRYAICISTVLVWWWCWYGGLTDMDYRAATYAATPWSECDYRGCGYPLLSLLLA